MKILYVLGSFYPAQNGGPNNTIYWAATQLACEGIEVSIASLKDGLTPQHIKDYGISFSKETFFDNLHVYFFSYFLNRYFSFSMYFWLFRHIRKFDGVMLTSIFFPFTWYAAILCRIFKIPFTIAPRGELEPGALAFKKFLKTSLLRLFVIKILSGSKCIIVTSEQEKNYTKCFFPARLSMKLLPNYMRMPDLTSPINHKDLSYRKGCLYLGRLHAKKGIENLIEAIDITNDSSITLTIAGSGEKKYIEKLQSIISLKNLGDRITFIGHVEGDRKVALYKTHKMLILPSFSENFGNVVVEALSFATPVISSLHTPWQEIEREKCGFWIDNSPSSLADAIIKINNMSDFDYQQMSINAYHFSRDRYDIKTKGPALKQIVIQLFS